MAWRCHCFIFFGSFGTDLSGQRRVGRNRRSLSGLYWRGVSNSQTVRNRCGLSSALPRLMIFSKDKRFEVRGDYLAERTINPPRFSKGIIASLGFSHSLDPYRKSRLLTAGRCRAAKYAVRKRAARRYRSPAARLRDECGVNVRCCVSGIDRVAIRCCSIAI
jgi:hypothetical protein